MSTWRSPSQSGEPDRFPPFLRKPAELGEISHEKLQRTKCEGGFGGRDRLVIVWRWRRIRLKRDDNGGLGVLQHDGGDADGSIRDGKFDRRNRRFAPGESSATGAISGTSARTPLLDCAGIAGTASGTCTTTSSTPTASASSPTIGSRTAVGRAGIPVGSTEFGTGVLSPLPYITQQSQSTVVPTGTSTVPCPTTVMSTTAGSSMSSGGC
jgi:hypothetical protein